jgi:hypothetical protein
MNEVERLREAMAKPQYFAPVDVARVMELGGRRRARRRLLTGAAMLLAFFVVAGSVFGVQIFRNTQDGKAVTVAAPHTAATDVVPLGTVVDTGIADAEGRAVLFFAHVRDTTGVAKYQLVLAHKATDGKLMPTLTIDADLSGDGFRSVTTGHPGSYVPLFGFFVGPVQHFKAVYGGDAMPVDGARVPELNVTVFWALPKYEAEDLDAASVVQLSAFDDQGNLLEYGHGPGR